MKVKDNIPHQSSSLSNSFLNRPKYRTSWRIKQLATPKRRIVCRDSDWPEFTVLGIRKSALLIKSCPDRIADAAQPYTRKLFAVKRTYKKMFPPKRMEFLNQTIERSNGTLYAKLGNCVVDLKKSEVKKNKPWTESEWKKHMEYIGPLAEPKKLLEPPTFKSKKPKWKPLPKLLPRIMKLIENPEFKIYRRLSEESWYRDPTKVRSGALKYVISERVKVLAKPREIPQED